MKSTSLYSTVAAVVVASIAHGTVCPLDKVDPFIGTGGNGHTTPAAAYPFGMVQPGPDTGHEGWERCSAYQYGDETIQRFSQNHLSGTGCSEFGDLGFMPSADDPQKALARDYRAGFEKEDEKASPGYYAVTLACGTKVEATCTRHVSLFRFTFPKGKPASLLFDPAWSFSPTKSVQVSPMKKRCVSGHVDREGWPDHEYWFAWEVSAEPTSSCVDDTIEVKDGTSPKFVYEFDNSKNNVIYLKVSLSRTSAKGARHNIDAEIPGWDFDGVLAANRAAWRGILGRVKAKGAPDKIKNLYTAIYHLCFQPNLISDVGEDDLYSTFSCWDTYRAAGPLYTILTPEYVPAFINSMLWHFDNNGFLPVWTLWGGDNQCMNGVHSVPMIVDAYLKGFKGVDWERAYECVRATLREDRGRCDAEYKTLDKYGYFPCDFMDEESVSRLLESCYDDACAARFAKALGGREADAKFFLDRSRAWTNCFDAATGFMRARDSKGAWREPFDPYAIDGDGLHNYTEGNAFHWNWHVMQEPNLLIEMLGGKSAAAKRLEGLFSKDSAKGADELSDVTGLIGQYCHGNEPCHHDIYFFTLMGRRDLAAKYIREVMDTLYYPSPTGLCGNEDCGQMSAWYVFSAMGFYPFDPCGGEYVLGCAQLEEIKLRVGSGELRVVREGEGEKVVLNGQPVDGAVIRHEDIMKGGTLAFVGGSAKYAGKGVKELETEWKNQSKQPFRIYRFCVDRTKSPTDCMQLSEFELLDADGKVIPARKFKLGYDDSGGDDDFGDGEKPECAVDGDLDTKWLDFRADHDADAERRSAVWIQFTFAEPTKLSGYRWYTANDEEDRDPRGWRLLGSGDGVNWIVVDKVEDFEATSDRNKLAFTAHFVLRKKAGM